MKIKTGKHRYSTLVKTLFLVGVVILLASLIFMIANLENSDKYIAVWTTFITIGIITVAMSAVFDLLGKRSKK